MGGTQSWMSSQIEHWHIEGTFQTRVFQRFLSSLWGINSPLGITITGSGMRTSAATFSAILLSMCFVAGGCESQNKNLQWNQRFVESRLDAAGAFSSEQQQRMEASTRSRVKPSNFPVELSFDDPNTVFEYVFGQLPEIAIVYPTERYYYYSFDLGEHKVSGNLRFTMADQGIVYFAYFDTKDNTLSHSLTLKEENGVVVLPQGNNAYSVEYGQKRVVFHLASEMLFRDESEKVMHNAVPLLDNEEVVTGVLDESGYAFILVFNTQDNALYYFLNPLVQVWDQLQKIEGTTLWSGKESGFVFETQKIEKTGQTRYLLLGVNAENIAANNYFDGPFDQVPPDLDLKDKLEASYPYVKLRGGIDQHGNFKQLEHQRVAISPYVAYMDNQQVVDRVQAVKADGSLQHVAALLTFESKRDFHKRIMKQPYPGTMSVFDYIKLQQPDIKK